MAKHGSDSTDGRSHENAIDMLTSRAAEAEAEAAAMMMVEKLPTIYEWTGRKKTHLLFLLE